MNKRIKETLFLLKNNDNKKWVWKNAWSKIATVDGVIMSVFSVFQAIAEEWPPAWLLRIAPDWMPEWVLSWSVVFVLIIATFVVWIISALSIVNFTSVKVQTSRSDCTIEVSMADSYLTNAFVKYPKSAMLIGLNKCMWFREAEPRSLVADLWPKLAEYGINKIEVQNMIDEELARIEQENPNIIDDVRKEVKVRRTWTPGWDEPTVGPGETEPDYIYRKNYKIGTIVGIDLKGSKEVTVKVSRKEQKRQANACREKRKAILEQYKYDLWMYKRGRVDEKPQEPEDLPPTYREYMKNPKNRTKKVTETLFRKLYFISNAEVVQGKDTKEPIKVAPDVNASVVENFSNIWRYFEMEEQLGVDPPEHMMYSQLLLPLIGGGVANEGYTDLEIFSEIVDLYYQHMRTSDLEGKIPAIRNLIINIRNNTAIESANSLNNRQIDMDLAKRYIEYRNKVNPPKSELKAYKLY